MNKVRIGKVDIDNVTMVQCIDIIDKLIQKRSMSYVVTPNVDHIVKLERDEEFLEVYKHANLVLADGMPLIWVSKILGTPIKEKVSGSDLFPKLCEFAAQKGYKVFFLGGDTGVVQKAAEVLKARYKNLKVCGVYTPTYGFEKKEAENKKIIKLLTDSAPDILFVGVGAPKQEKWIYNHKDQIKVPVSIGIGASFDFIAGTKKRAPKWMQSVGLEWFYRFIQEPRRMFKRYFVEDMRFITIIFKQIVKMHL
ncbi:WecB/TagA/CpsF family glycosyltransferase [Caloramator sp.]|uniref:WecB/TagA/CpsF family glycosyltransferase n=1 Tax=Caloramator sp. TaxID=1871330 RepID=UPI0025BCD028|nr:WecB/TagA/CpsF family glycosyltransferase [Caloramator sp.]